MKNIKRDFNRLGRSEGVRSGLQRARPLSEPLPLVGRAKSPPESISSDSSDEYEPLLRRDVENNVLTELSGDNIDSATPLWQHENALVRVPAQTFRWMYLSLLARPARRTNRFFKRVYRRLKKPGSWKRMMGKFWTNMWRTIEGLVLFRLCIPGGWPAATWTQRVLWYGGFCCICLLVSFSIWTIKTGRAFSDPSKWYNRTVFTDGGGHLGFVAE